MKDIAYKYREEGEKSAEVRAKAKLWKERLKKQLAVIASGFLQEGMSAAKAEIQAKASPEYEKYLMSVCDEIRQANVSESYMESLKMELDAERSISARQREEMKLT